MEKNMRINIKGEKYGILTVLEYSHTHSKKAYWVCKCECGGTKVVRANDLRTGKTTSCGCLMKESSRRNQKIMIRHNRLPHGEAAFNQLYSQYLHSAKKRNHFFNLTKEMFKEITSSACHYCGASPSRISSMKRGNGTYIYNGIDRVDNNKGYEKDNIVACCKTCNVAKNTLNYTDFINWGKQLGKHLETL